MRIKELGPVLFVALLALAVAGCVAPLELEIRPGSDSEAIAMTQPVVLDFNLGVEPPSLDPAVATDTASIMVLDETYLGLTKLDPVTREALPDLATDWEISEDGLNWTFHLRSDVPWVTYENGRVATVADENGENRMVTADDVVYGVKRTCDASTGSNYAYVLYIIAGCAEANAGEGSIDDIGVAAPDDRTVVFTLNRPASYFGQIASMWVARPMPQWLIEAKGDSWTEAGIYQSNGAYALAEWIHNDSMQLVRNPFWYGWTALENAGNIDVINITMIEESATAFAMYENNAIDLAGVPLGQMDMVRAEGSEFADEYHNAAINCTQFFGFTTPKPSVSDARVRRALSMAVDRQTLANSLLQDGSLPANAFTNPLNFGSPALDPEVAPWALPENGGGTGYEAAVKMAQALMTDAGYADGSGLNITLAHITSDMAATVAQAIQAMWRTAFPEIEVLIENQEFGVFLQTLDEAPAEAKPDVWAMGWCADYPHANNWIHEVFNPRQGSNWVLLNEDDPVAGALVTELADATITAQTASPEEQLALYKRAEQILIDEVAGIIPLVYNRRSLVIKPWLTYVDDAPMSLWRIDAKAKAAGR